MFKSTLQTPIIVKGEDVIIVVASSCCSCSTLLLPVCEELFKIVVSGKHDVGSSSTSLLQPNSKRKPRFSLLSQSVHVMDDRSLVAVARRIVGRVCTLKIGHLCGKHITFQYVENSKITPIFKKDRKRCSFLSPWSEPRFPPNSGWTGRTKTSTWSLGSGC